VLVKDERHYDRFDRVFAAHFKGAELALEALLATEIPADWLKPEFLLRLSEEEKARIQSLGGWDALMKTLRERLAEQKARHQGAINGSAPAAPRPSAMAVTTPKASASAAQAATAARSRSGTGASSRISMTQSSSARATSSSRSAGSGASRARARRRRWTSTARSIRPRAARGCSTSAWCRSATMRVKVPVPRHWRLDGRARAHLRGALSPQRGEFKHLEHFYFHNFVYEIGVEGQPPPPRASARRSAAHAHLRPRLPLVIVGDATMSPTRSCSRAGRHRALERGTGAAWMKRLLASYPRHVWLNPEAAGSLGYTPSVRITRELFEDRMFPLSLAGARPRDEVTAVTQSAIGKGANLSRRTEGKVASPSAGRSSGCM
jgi:hypothetical protein